MKQTIKISDEFCIMENKSTSQKVMGKAVFANDEWRFVIQMPLPLGVSMEMVNKSLKKFQFKIEEKLPTIVE